MKFLGNTPDNGAIVEFDSAEYAQLKRLVHAIRGFSSWDAWAMREDLPIPTTLDSYAGVFGAIRAFTVSRYELTELRNMVSRFEQVLQQREDD